MNKKKIHMNSKNYEKNGCGPDLDLPSIWLIVLHNLRGVVHI